MQGSGEEKHSELRVTRDVAEFVALDASLNFDHTPGTVWPSVSTDTRFTNLVHEVLKYGSQKYSGLDEKALAKYEGLIEGMSFAVEAIRRAMNEQRADTEITSLLDTPQQQEGAA
jgi:hypothetical protein